MIFHGGVAPTDIPFVILVAFHYYIKLVKDALHNSMRAAREKEQKARRENHMVKLN